MASFTTRIELHGAPADAYDELHRRMEAVGFARTITGVDRKGNWATFALPTAEYDFESSKSAHDVRDLAKQVADGVKAGAWVLVTEVADRAWETIQVSRAA